MEKVLNKANGHIVQADWNEQDSSSFSYICNKPDLENIGLTEEEVIEIINDNLPDIPQPLTEQQVKNIVNTTIPAGTNVVLGRNSSGVLNTTAVSNTQSANSIVQRDTAGRVKSNASKTRWTNYYTSLAALRDTSTYGPDDSEVVTIKDLKQLMEKFPINLEAIDNLSNWSVVEETGFAYSDNLKGWVIAPTSPSGPRTYKDNYGDNTWGLFPIAEAIERKSYIPLKTSDGQLKVNTYPEKTNDAVSKAYVDQTISQVQAINKKNIVNSAKTIVHSSIKWSDLEWAPDGNTSAAVGATACFYAYPVLPNDPDITYTISLTNMPTVTQEDNGDGWKYLHAGGCQPADEILGGWYEYESNDWYGMFCAESMGLWHYSDDWSELEDGTLIYTQTPITREAQVTGPWKIVFGEACGGASLESLQYTCEQLQDTVIHYTYEINEFDPSGPIHSIDLHSDAELHYDYAVTELTINNLVRCYPPNIAQQWVISFIAGDEAPVVTVPHQVELTSIPMRDESGTVSENFPLEWIGGEPQFEANKRYMITFKQINSVVYASCVELPDTH